MLDPETLVYDGEAVKLLGTFKRADGVEVARLGGYLVKFSGPSDPDLLGDYFDAGTDFGLLSRKGKAELPAYYQHGFDAHFKGAAIGEATVSLDEFGAWAEYQVELRTDYEKHLVAMAEAGKMGQSSGAVGHLVEREQVGKSWKITRWPLGEASLTPTPAEPRTSAVPLKQLMATAPAALETAPAAIKAQSLDRRVSAVYRAVNAAYPWTDNGPGTWVAEVFDEYAILNRAEKYHRVPYSYDTGKNVVTLAAPAEWTEVQEKREWVEAKSVYLSFVQSPPTKSAEAHTPPMEPNNTPTPEQAAAVAAPSVDYKALAEAIAAQQAEAKAAADKEAADFAKQAEAAGYVKATGRIVAPRFSAPTKTSAPAFTSGRPDNEAEAFKAWIKNDDGGFRGTDYIVGGHEIEFKASNATDMNITTAADGGYAVPTGHYNQIIAKRDEARLANQIGVRILQGVGTTLNVPIDNEEDGEFVTTSEAAAYDLDAPAIGQKAFTKVKFSKEVRISEELMDDEASGLMSFLEDFVSRGFAKTHNSLLILEAIAAGTVIKATSSATVLAVGELEDAVFNGNLAPYLDDSTVSFVMRSPTYGKVTQLGSTSNRWYGDTHQGSISAGQGTAGRSLLGFPVYFTQYAEAYGTTGNEFAFFGNWNYMGLYEGPSFRVLRNPFLYAATGQTALHYSFRCDYGVLQAEAIGMIEHA